MTLPWFRTIGKVLIVLFCIWHMFSVLVYSYTRSLQETTSQWMHDRIVDAKLAEDSGDFEPYPWVERNFKKIVRPYVLSMGTWQSWNLFSPDPLRRVPVYHYEVERGGQWKPVFTLGPDHLEWYRQSTLLKTMRRMDKEEKYAPVQKQLAAYLCNKHELNVDDLVRLRWSYYVTPKKGPLWSPSYWRSWTPTWRHNIIFTETCSSLQ